MTYNDLQKKIVFFVQLSLPLSLTLVRAMKTLVTRWRWCRAPRPTNVTSSKMALPPTKSSAIQGILIYVKDGEISITKMMMTNFTTYSEMNGETANIINKAWFVRAQKLFSKQ